MDEDMSKRCGLPGTLVTLVYVGYDVVMPALIDSLTPTPRFPFKALRGSSWILVDHHDKCAFIKPLKPTAGLIIQSAINGMQSKR